MFICLFCFSLPEGSYFLEVHQQNVPQLIEVSSWSKKTVNPKHLLQEKLLFFAKQRKNWYYVSFLKSVNLICNIAQNSRQERVKEEKEPWKAI
jgi:hypothetical protein